MAETTASLSNGFISPFIDSGQSVDQRQDIGGDIDFDMGRMVHSDVRCLRPDCVASVLNQVAALFVLLDQVAAAR